MRDLERFLSTSRLPAPHRHAHGSVSRRRFLGSAAGVVGAAAATVVANPATALAGKPADPAPKPIPGGFDAGGGLVFHVNGFGLDADPATITDFNGFIGVTDVQGTGTATYKDGSTDTLLFDTDMRFMKGVYVGQDGTVHRGTFGFV